MRWKGLGPISVAYTEKNVSNPIVSLIEWCCLMKTTYQVPDKPSTAVEEHRGQADKSILTKLGEVGVHAFNGQFCTTHVSRLCRSSKSVPFGRVLPFSTSLHPWKCAT